MSTELLIPGKPETPDAILKKLSLADFETVENVDVQLTAELGRRSTTLGELLGFRTEDILVFSRPIGEHVDVYAGNVLIGTAEILVTEDKLTVRIADLMEDTASSNAGESKPRLSSSSSSPEGLARES